MSVDDMLVISVSVQDGTQYTGTVPSHSVSHLHFYVRRSMMRSKELFAGIASVVDRKRLIPSVGMECKLLIIHFGLDPTFSASSFYPHKIAPIA